MRIIFDLSEAADRRAIGEAACPVRE